MRADDFIEQEISAGCVAHYSHGVCWQVVASGVCRPLLPLLQIEPGQSKPKLHKSLIGYNHLAPVGSPFCKPAAFYEMSAARLRAYSLTNLNDGKRRAILKARRTGIVIRKLTDLKPHLGDLQQIAISNAARNGYGRSPEFYSSNHQDWQISLCKEFSKPRREWWGAFLHERLGGYMYGYLIEKTMHLANVKVHSDFVKQHANDFLLFSLVDYCKGLPECEKVNVGRSAPSAPTVDQWKEFHGFERFNCGEHYCYRPPIALALRGLLHLSRFRPASEVALISKVSGGRFTRFYHRALQMARRIESVGPRQGGIS